MQIQLKMDLRVFSIIGISIFIAGIFSGCEDTGPLVKLDLFYVNNSSKPMEISHYARVGNDINSKVIQTINIESGDTVAFFSSKFENSENADISDFDDFIINNRLYDSAYLVFDNAKFMVFSKGELNTEIFFIENYEGRKVKENEFEFFYTFTEEDYENAQEID